MAREIGVTFALGAALKGGFKAAFQGASASARNVASAIRSMEQSSTGKLGQALVSQREKIRTFAGSLNEARKTLHHLQAQAQTSGGATGMMARQIELAQNRVNSLTGSLNRQLAAWRTTVAETRTAAGSVGALSREYAQLSQRMERARRVQQGLAANRAQADALRSQRSDLNSRIMGTAAAAGTIAVPVKLSIDFEDAITQVGAVANASDEDMQRLTATARQLGRDTMFSASQAAEGMKYLAMAGFNTSQTIAAMPGMLDLAAAANTDLGRTADIASDILTAFGMKAGDMGEVADTLTKAFTSSNTDLSMLGDTMKYVAPVAHSLGMTLQETAAYAGSMANAGIKASQGGTVLRAAMLRIAAPPKASADTLAKLSGLEGEELEKLQEELGDSANTLEELGMTTKDASGNLRPMVDILEELNMRTAQMGNAEKAEVFKKVFGTEASAGMIALAEQAAKTVDDEGNQIVDSTGKATTAMRKNLDATNQYLGESRRIAEKQASTTKGSLMRLRSAWEDAGISVGNLFLPAIQSASSVLSFVANIISNFTERFPRLSKSVALVVGGIITLTAISLAAGLVFNTMKSTVNGVRGAYLRMVAAQIPATASTTAFGAASTAAGTGARFFAGGLRSILMATGVGAVLVGIGYAIQLLIDHWDEVVAAMKFAWAWVTDTWGRLGVFFTELGNNLGEIFGGWGEIITYPFVLAWNAITALWNGIGEFFSGVWNGISDSASGVWQGIVDWAGWAVDGIMGIWNGVLDFFNGIIESISAVFQAFFDWLKEKFAWVFDSINAVSGFLSSIGDAVSGAWNKAFGDDEETASKEGAKAGEAAAKAQAKAEAKEEAKKGGGTFTPVSRKEVNAANPQPEKKGKGGGGGKKRSGGGGGGGSRGSSSASSSGGPVTVVTLAGDNSQPQTLFIPAAANAGSSSASSGAGSSFPASARAALASTPARVLPKTPEILGKAQASRQPAEPKSISVEIMQNFDLIAQDAAAVRKVMEALKPDFEALVRRALEKMQSDRRRTAYAQ